MGMAATSSRSWAIGATGLSLVLLAGCASAPADVASGDYRAYAASAEIGQVPPVTLVIDGSTLTFGEADVLTSVQSSPGTAEVVVCPPDRTGIPALLGPTLSIGPANFAEPALVGDCGDTSPARVTVVDLTSADGTVAPFPFTRWVEFCATADPDC